MKYILVTGGSGLVGQHLQLVLPSATFISSKDYNLTKEQDVERLFTYKWDHVIHLAARVGGIVDNIEHPAEFAEENLLMNSLLLKHARLQGVPRLTAILSTCIYPDQSSKYPMLETDLFNGPPQVTNFAYAIAKRALAMQINAYNSQYNLHYNYLIPCNLYGLHEKNQPQKNHFLTALLYKLANATKNKETSITLLGTGKPLRQFLYAEDLANVLKECITQDITTSFNVAPNEHISIQQIAELAAKACNLDVQIEFDNTSPDGQFRKDVSNQLLKEILPDLYLTPLEQGINKVYKHYLANL